MDKSADTRNGARYDILNGRLEALRMEAGEDLKLTSQKQSQDRGSRRTSIMESEEDLEWKSQRQVQYEGTRIQDAGAIGKPEWRKRI